MVESDEVIHVGVRHENVCELEKLTRRETLDVTQVKEQGPSLVTKSDEEGRITERPVDQPRQESITHNEMNYPSASCGVSEGRCLAWLSMTHQRHSEAESRRISLQRRS